MCGEEGETSVHNSFSMFTEREAGREAKVENLVR